MLVDTDATHLKAKAAEFGIEQIATSLKGALTDESVHAIAIATPHPDHAPSAIAAAEAGKHVIVEKPMAMTVDEANRMIAAAEANGVRLFVAENASYSPATTTLRGIVDSGDHTGSLTFATIIDGFRADNYGYPGRRAWLALPQHGGTGTWLLHGIHTLAQLRAVFGEVATVYARETKTPGFSRPDLEGTMTCLFGMESGLSVLLVQSCETRFPRGQKAITLFGENGSVHADRDGMTVHSIDVDAATSTPRRIDYPATELSDYALEFRAFAAYIAGDKSAPTDGYSERRTLAIAQAAMESVATGRPVILGDRFAAL